MINNFFDITLVQNYPYVFLAIVLLFALAIFMLPGRKKSHSKKRTGKKRLSGRRRSLSTKPKNWRVKEASVWLSNFRDKSSAFLPQQRINYIRSVDPFMFEEILLRTFAERGYKVRRTPMTRDGGSDGFVYINDRWHVIQAKRYEDYISKADVDKLLDFVDRNNEVTHGLFIHTGKTSRAIKTWVKNEPKISLISGIDTVLKLLDGDALSVAGTRLQKI